MQTLLPEAAFTALTVALTNDSELSVTFTSVREVRGQPAGEALHK